MKSKQKKYNGSKSHKNAILHMIGQVTHTTKDCVYVADIAAWMNVSKTTALKHLKEIEKMDEIDMTKIPYKSNSYIYKIWLDGCVLHEYLNGEYIRDYLEYAQEVLGVIIQDE